MKDTYQNDYSSLLLCRELIDESLKAASVEDLHALCSKLCLQFGFDYFIYGALYSNSLTKPKLTIINGFPQEWWENYSRCDYIKIDPIVSHVINKITPLDWKQVDQTAAGRTKEFMSDAYEFSLKSGISFPAHGDRNESAVISLVSTCEYHKVKDLIFKVLPYGQLITAYIHEAARRVFEKERILVDPAHLTQREKECLTWTAEGKTAWEISQILDISERTVIFHLTNVITKLNVSNKTQAVARAVSESIIKPHI